MANLLVKGVRLLAVGAALSSLHGCMLDPAGIGLTLAQAAYTPDDPEPIDHLTPLKDMYRGQDCRQLDVTDGALRTNLGEPGEHNIVPTALEAIRQVKAEKGCPAEAQVAATVAPATAPAVNTVPATNTASTANGAPLTVNVAPPTSGRGWLGASLLPADKLHDVLVRDLGLPDSHGVLVTGVIPGSAAAQAGIKAADVIQSINGQVFDQTTQLIAYLASNKAGTPVTLKLWRNRSSITLVATLAGTQPPPIYAATGSLIYCYAMAMPGTLIPGGGSYWLSTPFALPGATVSNAAERGKAVGQQFKQYLLSQGVNPETVKEAFGICSQGIGNANTFLEAEENSRKHPAFLATNSTSVKILWQP
ncbi:MULTISPECIES: PDZ domain-containing protein [unclassified Pseudomonas]|uniref:PDZ domain-containing protein n=1 Tax=unclassified Pseudomonas TaxID=196821 RepID=UPI0021C9FD85|nr:MULTISPECIES: PDZ domain-containing protein [unclassified Pseudomonas]MCU1732252.1 PDZ domain-containing protein [Pseudomonas sp. 20P_3.2_Bac4]MCU1745211.1 PDZ domain-containing protein [Pseudomonas sp. 20P_3.2_Bac5]